MYPYCNTMYIYIMYPYSNTMYIYLIVVPYYSWHLWCVLHTLGYNHTHPSHLISLHHNFASQLESIGAWHWAVFVLMHIEGAWPRGVAIDNVLYRHCTSNVELSEEELFVLEDLGVTKQHVYQAKVHTKTTCLHV